MQDAEMPEDVTADAEDGSQRWKVMDIDEVSTLLVFDGKGVGRQNCSYILRRWRHVIFLVVCLG